MSKLIQTVVGIDVDGERKGFHAVAECFRWVCQLVPYCVAWLTICFIFYNIQIW